MIPILQVGNQGRAYPRPPGSRWQSGDVNLMLFSSQVRALGCHLEDCAHFANPPRILSEKCRGETQTLFNLQLLSFTA